jgi:hypothetical protein
LLAHVAVVFFGLCLKSRHFSVVTEVAQSPNHQTIWPNHTEFWYGQLSHIMSYLGFFGYGSKVGTPQKLGWSTTKTLWWRALKTGKPNRVEAHSWKRNLAAHSVADHFWTALRNYHRIGWWEKLQERFPSSMVKPLYLMVKTTIFDGQNPWVSG